MPSLFPPMEVASIDGKPHELARAVRQHERSAEGTERASFTRKGEAMTRPRIDALAVECPTCNASGGECCIGMDSPTLTHTKRVALAQARARDMVTRAPYHDAAPPPPVPPRDEERPRVRAMLERLRAERGWPSRKA